MRVLFVCTGNICRSPTAEGVFRQLARQAGIEVHAESAGTHDYHVGDAPDRRSMAHALKRGYDLSSQRARQVRAEDFEQFDLLLAMDKGHRDNLLQRSPPQHRHKIRLLLEFAGREGHEVPDPYYGAADGFEQVLEMTEAASRGLLEHIRASRRG
jgi:protein-tyrosine phosphatase